MKIMYCHDGTDRAQAALEKVVNFFKGVKPEMLLVSVAKDIPDASLENARITESYEAERKVILRRAAEWVANQGLDVDVMVATGEPRAMIMKAIEKKSPAIVVVARMKKSEKESVFQKSLSAYLVKNCGAHLFIMGPS